MGGTKRQYITQKTVFQNYISKLALSSFMNFQESGINLIYFTLNFDFASICKKEDPRTVKLIDLTPESEDEVIREEVSHKLDIPLVNPLKSVCRDSTETKAPT